MNTATIMDIAWEGAQVAFRLIMTARSRKDAEATLHQLRALGETPRSDVDGIEARARERLEAEQVDELTREGMRAVAEARADLRKASGGPLDGGG